MKESQVHTLDFSRNEIGDEGARDLGLALKNTLIHTLDLLENNISQEVQETLREMLPRVKVRF